jgi:nucleoside-diphosphate-sugar epimerase
VAERLAKLVGSSIEPEFGDLPDRSMEQECTANTGDAYARLGWASKTALDDGLKLTVDWYRKNAGAFVGSVEMK